MNVWYGILICGLFASSFAKSIPLKADKQPFTIEEAALDKLKQKKLEGVWISDTEYEYRDLKTGDVNILNAATLKTTLFVPNSVIEKYKGVSYNVSADRRFMLIKYDSKILFRRSTLSRYTVYSISDKKYYDVHEGRNIKTIEWSPSGNALTYVYKNNIYYLPMITSTMKPLQITTDGIPGVIFNGATDWVYEEEVLCTDKAFYYSPKGDQLIYVKFNDTRVGEVKYMLYGQPGNYSQLYPTEFFVRFPKVSTINPLYEIWWVNLTNVKNQKMLQKFDVGPLEREVFYGNVWLNNSVAASIFSNRVQNESQIALFELHAFKTVVIFKDKNPRGWANTEIPKFSESPNRMVKIMPMPLDKDEYDHLVLITDRGEAYNLTGGAYEVIDILDWDRKNKVIYYRATEVNSPSTIQVYRISEAKGSKPYCLTCRIKSPEGRGCKHATATFSKGYSYVVIQCNGPDPRMIYVYKNENPMKDPLTILCNSTTLRTTLSKKLMPEIMNLTAPIPGFTAQVRLYLPPNMDKSGKTKYPMLVYTYGGINSKLIYDDFKIDYEMYLTTNRSVIYATIDGRNTNNNGKNMLYAGYQRIGTLEMEDQITVTKYLQKTFSFIDTKRTGIWGWSFGGYSTLRILQLDKDRIFKCGVAVAPAVDWVLYNTMWSERYMRTFKENKDGYLKASLFTDIKKLKGRNFYLITGNADDNVHYQQPMLLTRALELNDILFESLSYPDEAHSLFGVRPHLYYSMDRYWSKCFNL